MKGFLIFLAFIVFIFFPFLVSAAPGQVDISVQATVSGTGTPPIPPPPPPPGGGGTTIYIPPETKVIFKGKAYPLAYLTLLKDEKVIAVFQSEETGYFKKEINGLAGGTYDFGIWAEDSDGRKSVTIGFTVGVIAKMTTTISGIFISPTIELGPTQVEKGQSINILGQVFPESEVNIFISSKEMVKNTKASSRGNWSYQLDTNSLEEAEHRVRAKASYLEGEQSSFSQTLSFLVLKKGAMVCKGADLNFDRKVNIIDFSILLYFWGQKQPANRCADINFDGTVNIIDFSIMMYYWTG